MESVTGLGNRSLQCVVFDLDGTLIDSCADIAAALNHTLTTLGRPTLSLANVSRYIGDGALELVRRGLQLASDDPRLHSAHATFLAYYAEHPVVHTCAYDGVFATLQQLQCRKALCTNKPRVITERVLEKLGLQEHFVSVVCGDDLATKKPSPEPLFHIARSVDVSPSTLVMVGDGAQDIRSGQAAGALTVGVSYGLHPEAMRDANPDYVIDDLRELPGLLNRLATEAG